MATHVSATEAARTFSDILNRVRYRGETFIVERGGEPICRIEPATVPSGKLSDVVRLMEAAQKLDDGWADAVERATKKQPKLPRDPWRR